MITRFIIVLFLCETLAHVVESTSIKVHVYNISTSFHIQYRTNVLLLIIIETIILLYILFPVLSVLLLPVKIQLSVFIAFTHQIHAIISTHAVIVSVLFNSI